jgi:hypothetical protein
VRTDRLATLNVSRRKGGPWAVTLVETVPGAKMTYRWDHATKDKASAMAWNLAGRKRRGGWTLRWV